MQYGRHHYGNITFSIKVVRVHLLTVFVCDSVAANHMLRC